MVGGLCTLWAFLSPLHRTGLGSVRELGEGRMEEIFPFPLPSGSRDPVPGGWGGKRGVFR